MNGLFNIALWQVVLFLILLAHVALVIAAFRAMKAPKGRTWLIWLTQVVWLSFLSAWLLLMFTNAFFNLELGLALALPMSLIFPPLLPILYLVADSIGRWFIITTFLPVAVIALGFATRSPVTRRFAPTVAFFSGLASSLILGNAFWDRQMCQSATELGLRDIQRERFLSSLSLRTEYRRSLAYATAYKGDQQFHWAYDNPRFHESRIPMRLPSSATRLDCGE